MQVYVLLLKWPGHECRELVGIGPSLEWAKDRAHYHLEEVDDEPAGPYFFDLRQEEERELTTSGVLHRGKDGWCQWSTEPHTWKAPLVNGDGDIGDEPGGYIIEIHGVEGLEPENDGRREESAEVTPILRLDDSAG